MRCSSALRDGHLLSWFFSRAVKGDYLLLPLYLCHVPMFEDSELWTDS